MIDSPLISQGNVKMLTPLLWHPDPEVLSNICATLFLATDYSNNTICIEEECLTQLMDLMFRDEDNVVISALKTVVNLTRGSTFEVSKLIDNNITSHFVKLLKSEDREVQRLACVGIANLVAEKSIFVDLVCDSAADALIGCFDSARGIVRIEALLAISNMCRSASMPQRQQMIDQGIHVCLCCALKSRDARFRKVALDSLSNLLEVRTIPKVKKAIKNLRTGKSHMMISKYWPEKQLVSTPLPSVVKVGKTPRRRPNLRQMKWKSATYRCNNNYLTPVQESHE